MKKTAVVFAAIVATILSLIGFGAGSADAAPKVRLGGGSHILILKGGNNAAACTLTTIGRSQGRLVGLTAGHCGKPGQTVISETNQNAGPLGTIKVSNDALDVAIIEFNSNVQPVRTVSGTTITRINTAPMNFPTTLCKQGRTSGHTCGVVWANDGPFHFTQIGVVEGDSGAPIVRGTELVGMVNAYYFLAMIGPETGTNIKPIMQLLKAKGYGDFRVV